jgi:hypothetical protein
MANRHIKVINGRKYYYESIRRGKKVTSRYIGPVEARMRKSRKSEEQQEQVVQDLATPATPEEGNYIG